MSAGGSEKRTSTRLLLAVVITAVIITVMNSSMVNVAIPVIRQDFGVSEAQVGWAEALGAFAFVRFLSAVPLTPGGVGIVELGLSAALVYAGGPRAEVVAAVLAFRALTYLVQIPFGAITYAYWQHGRRWREGRSAGAD